jgi:hypothetical protein
MCTGRRPFTRTKPKEIQIFRKMVKNSKNWKNAKITYENFFLVFSSPVDQYVKMILRVRLLKPAVEKTVKILQLDLQNGPRKSFFQSYIYGAFGRIEYYMKCSISNFVGGRKQWPKITVPSVKRGKCWGPRGDHFMSKRRAWPEKGKTSKSEKTVKFQKILMKIFLHFFRSRSTLTSKWSPYPYYLGQPSRKQKKSHI